MNYYNPYFYSMPTSVAPRVGLLGRLFGNSRITFSSILNGTQRALNFANQAIPLVKQVKPMIGNAKTMFKVMNEFKRSEKSNNTNRTSKISLNRNTNKNYNNTNNYIKKVDNTNEFYETNNGPTFFV